MVDMIMVGSLGPISIAAVGLGNQVFFFSVAIVQAVSIGTAALVAQAVGRKDPKQQKKLPGNRLVQCCLLLFAQYHHRCFSRQIISGLVYFMAEEIWN